MAVVSKLESDGKQRSAIISNAMHLFGKQGFTGTSMRDIANAVGLLPGSLYAHINGKEGLLFEIVTDGIGRFIEAVQTHASADSDPVERMRKMIVAHVEVVVFVNDANSTGWPNEQYSKTKRTLNLAISLFGPQMKSTEYGAT